MLDALGRRLAQAARRQPGHVELLAVLCADEAARCDATGLEWRLEAAPFEPQATIEEFDFSFTPRFAPPPPRTSPHSASWRRVSR